jgi:hypothetical protein
MTERKPSTVNRSRSRWYWLLAPPFPALLLPALYSHADPTLFGFPFFYWYQFAWVVLTAALTGIVFVKTL